MINRIHMRMSNKLIGEYKLVFGSKDNEKIFIFLRKYLKFIESDDHDFQRLFLLTNPLKYKKENQLFMKEFNTKVWEFLNQVLQANHNNIKKNFIAGEAACYMGASYEYGLFGNARDPSKAFSYYTISAQLNHDFGTFKLAQCYEKGLGTNRNISKAIYFFRCAAKLGLVDGMHVYGSILANGYLQCPKDVKTGLHFLSLASLKANKIYPYALFDIARWYENKSQTNDVTVDIEYATDMYIQGGYLNEPNCIYRIAKANELGELNEKVNKVNAFEYYKKAAQLGQVDAQMSLCEAFCVGIDSKIKTDPEQSFYWGLKAATKCNGKAAYILGEYCQRGYGTNQNSLNSLWWFLISKELGYEEAQQKTMELKKEINRMDEGPVIPKTWCWPFCC